jgi:hypothetical protein
VVPGYRATCARATGVVRQGDLTAVGARCTVAHKAVLAYEHIGIYVILYMIMKRTALFPNDACLWNVEAGHMNNCANILQEGQCRCRLSQRHSVEIAVNVLVQGSRQSWLRTPENEAVHDFRAFDAVHIRTGCDPRGRPRREIRGA